MWGEGRTGWLAGDVPHGRGNRRALPDDAPPGRNGHPVGAAREVGERGGKIRAAGRRVTARAARTGKGSAGWGPGAVITRPQGPEADHREAKGPINATISIRLHNC